MRKRDIIIRIEYDADKFNWDDASLELVLDNISDYYGHFKPVYRSDWIKSDMIDYDVTILGSDSSFDRLET